MDLVWVWTCCVITDISHAPGNKEKARQYPGFAVSSSRLTFCQALSTKTIILRYTKYREDNTDCRISHFALTLVDVTRPDRLSLTQYGQPHCWEKGLLVTLRIIGSHLRIKTKVLGAHILGKATVAVQYWMISALSIGSLYYCSDQGQGPQGWSGFQRQRVTLSSLGLPTSIGRQGQIFPEPRGLPPVQTSRLPRS